MQAIVGTACRKRVALAVAVMLAFVASSCGESESDASALPGVVPQSSVAMDAGVTIRAERAVFSGLSVDVWLRVTSADKSMRFAGIEPGAADLDGEHALAVIVGADGLNVLRFRATDGLGKAASAPLTIRSLVRATSSPPFEEIEGTWRLDLSLPSGDAAEAARKVQARPPQVVGIAGQDMVVELRRTSSATVVHYDLPPGVVELTPPRLRVGERYFDHESFRAEDESGQDVWFAETPADVEITVIFEHLVAPNPSAKARSFVIALDDFDPPRDEPGAAETLTVGWEPVNASPGLKVVDVQWTRDVATSLIVFLDGHVGHDPATRPLATGDGALLPVGGFGQLGRPGEPGGRTSVYIELEGDDVPRRLEVSLGAEAIGLEPFEVAFPAAADRERDGS